MTAFSIGVSYPHLPRIRQPRCSSVSAFNPCMRAARHLREKAAERRVAEVVCDAKAQRAQTERELADAAIGELTTDTELNHLGLSNNSMPMIHF